MIKNRILAIAAALFAWTLSFAQAPEDVVKWTVAPSKDGSEIVFTGKIMDGWHVYDLKNEYTATTVEFSDPRGYSLVGSPYEISKSQDFDGDNVFFKEIKFTQKIKLTGEKADVSGTVTYQACNDQMCTPPIDWEFSTTVAAPAKAEAAPETTAAENNSETSDSEAVAPESDPDGHSTAIADPEAEDVISEANTEESRKAGGSLWGLILEAIIWGFAMLLTPCVFPMVPMTVSFFMKGNSSMAEGRWKAAMYGLFIVLLYTVPISLIILITRIVGGDAVTADIFNWLATHWLPNILFFIVFMIFAASFFGAFEITLPSKWVNGADSKANKKSLGGIFFLALTLVLVSFSCTGPIVGSVLIKSTQGQFWTPMITMLAFSLAFALPFTLLAMFPSLLKKLPKSGGWLNSVKVVLGFIEVALGFKFLSVADQTYHWGLLDREVYLAIWIAVFFLLGLYLLGKIRFANDDKIEHIGVTRLALSIAVFAFVIYLIPGMWGAPLKALSGYLPPVETQDFILPNIADGGNAYRFQQSETSATGQTDHPENKYDLKMPLGLNGYFNLDEAIAASKKEGKPVFVDITGHGCVNCREMESRVWSDPEVLNILKDKYIICALYTDDKSRLDEKDWITTPSGKVLKDLGRANAFLVRERFGVNAQPNYALLDSEGRQMVPIRGYNLDVDGFVAFLNSGLKSFDK